MLYLCKKIFYIAFAIALPSLGSAYAASPSGMAESEQQWNQLRREMPRAAATVTADNTKIAAPQPKSPAPKQAPATKNTKKAQIQQNAPQANAINEQTQNATAQTGKQDAKQAKPPVPKRTLKQPPVSRMYMHAPSASDFSAVVSKDGGYTMAMPMFGPDPLAEFDNLSDIMIVRTASSNLATAATVLDSSDTAHYKATQPLPTFDDKKILWQWEHVSTMKWQCVLSTVADYHGDKMVLEASSGQGAKTYQLLYVFPAAKMNHYLPLALYSLHSFKLQQVK